jgi:hypothetical protein
MAKSEGKSLCARQRRRKAKRLRKTFALVNLAGLLPLRPVWPVDGPTYKKRFRSSYQYLGFDELLDRKALQYYDYLDIVLRLFDFSGLRPVLSQHYQPSAKGTVPFDPVSLVLTILVRRWRKWAWRKIANELRKPKEGAVLRRLLGFTDVTPSESGLRYFFNQVGRETFERVDAAMTQCLYLAGFFPQPNQQGRFQGYSLVTDGMIHQARSRMRCRHVSETCYQSLDSFTAGRRPCPAQDEGAKGCACHEQGSACKERCRHTTPPDRQAAYVYYSGSNKYTAQRPDHKAGLKKRQRGKHFFGYRSVAMSLLDDELAVYWPLSRVFAPCNRNDHLFFMTNVDALHRYFDWLKIGEMVGDAGFATTDILDWLYDQRILRVIDVKFDPSDENKEAWRARGYDDLGRPVCEYGFQLRANGYDTDKGRRKFVCQQVCRASSRRPTDCPFLDPHRPLGMTVNVGRRHGDGSNRLTRDLLLDSKEWKWRLARRNSSESRNSRLENLNLKRLPVFGADRGEKEVILGDTLVKLTNVARLVWEASLLTDEDA